MFPGIGKSKGKRNNPLIEPLVKEWTDIQKDLSGKYKNIIGKMSYGKLSDFTKVCRLKEIPDFYIHYFIYHVYWGKQQQAEQSISKEITYIINSQSHFHRIYKVIQERQQMLLNAKNTLEVVEGLRMMNEGKNVTSNVKNKINELMKNCQTLQDIKHAENSATVALAETIIDIRHKTKDIFQEVGLWRESLRSLSEAPSIRKLKIVFPYNGVSCIYLGFYDLQFLASSFLKKQYSISFDKNPFLLFGKEPKRKNEFHEIFSSIMNTDKQSYQSLAKKIIEDLPLSQTKDNEEQKRVKEQEKIIQLKQIKAKQHQKAESQDKKKKQEKVKKTKSKKKIKDDEEDKHELPVGVKRKKNIIDIEKILAKNRKKKNRQNQSLEKIQKDSSIDLIKRPQSNEKQKKQSGQRSQKQISNIYENKRPRRNNTQAKYEKILNQKLNLERELKEAKSQKKEYQNLLRKADQSAVEEQKKRQLVASELKHSSTSLRGNLSFDQKIGAVYGKKRRSEKKSLIERSIYDKSQIQNMIGEKKILQKELKDRQKEINKYENMIKKIEKKNEKQSQRKQSKLKKYSQQLSLLKSKVTETEKQKKVEQNKKVRHNKSASQAYLTKSPVKENPFLNIVESKLQSQKSNRRDLEKQIRELNKQKIKLEQILKKSEDKVSKDREIFDRKIEKYERTIQNLKQEKQNNQQDEQNQTKIKKSSSLKMYTTTPLKQKSPKRQEKEQNQHSRSANFFKLSPELRKKKESKKKYLASQIIIQRTEHDDHPEKKQIKSKNKIEIVQTKKTIEIIYQKRKKDKQKKKQEQERIENVEIQKMKKEKEELITRIQKQESRKQQNRKSTERQSKRNQKNIEKYKEIIERQRNKKYELQHKIKELKKNMYDQFEEKLTKEKNKFNDEKKALLLRIQNEKEERIIKQKYLSNQMKYLKQMQSNQRELIQLLEHEKKQRKKKQLQLQEQISKKEELLTKIQIEEIKKGIEHEVRRELEVLSEIEDQNSEQDKNRKFQIEQQIEKIQTDKNKQLQEIDEQNEKLKGLIQRIKQEQGKLLKAIQTTIQIQENEDTQSQKSQISQNQSKKSLVKNMKEASDDEDRESQQQKYNTQQVQRQFDEKLQLQMQKEQKRKKQLIAIEQSDEYMQKSRVEELVEMYLKNPHEYPQKKQYQLSPNQKKQIKQNVLKNNRQALDFEKQLMALKNVQKFVPTDKDDVTTSHWLNLKQVYQKQEVNKLRQELFPAIKQNQYENDEKQLSYESDETPPPVTIHEHVKAHAKKYPPMKKNSKNFLAINRMRVLMLEQNRKERERQMIEQQLKKKKAKRYKKVKKPEQEEKQMSQEQKISQNQKKSHESQHHEQKQEKQKQQSDYSYDFQEEEKPKEQRHKNEIKTITEEKSEKQESQSENIETNKIEITNQHSSLIQEKKQLEKDIRDFQDEIRSYISGQQKFEIYQQFINETEIEAYIKELLQMSSMEIQNLNNNPTLISDLEKHISLIILIAKDKNNMEIGIGIFHKQYLDGYYICDYLMAHNMRNFLNLSFNFSRYIFKVDHRTNRIEYFFDTKKLEDEISILHFMDFENRCKRLGQVYVHTSQQMRKYVLRRNLFQSDDIMYEKEGKGLKFMFLAQVHDDYMKQRKYGFHNMSKTQYTSSTAILAAHLKKNQGQLAVFREKAEDDLSQRELLLTVLHFIKKEVQIRNLNSIELNMEKKLQLCKDLHDKFNIEDNGHRVSESQFIIEHELSTKTKRCTFEVNDEQIHYIIQFPEDATTKIQSSNSSETGIFLSLIPKYKVLFIEAGQFINMNNANPEMNIFFYVKHFIKNIIDVKKENYPRVFIPEFLLQDHHYLREVSEAMNASVFSKDQMKIGWINRFSNSVVFPPSHKDLVLRKPLIVSLLSANVERVVEGTPIYAKLIQ